MRNLIYFLLLSIMLVSCGGSSELSDSIDGIPFQSSANGKWGMLAPDGMVIFENEFKEQPSISMNGRYLVKNKDGLYKVYKTGKEVVSIGDAYLKISPFNEKVTPAVKKNECVKLIDVNCNEVKVLDKIGSKRIKRVSSFRGGVATVHVEGEEGALYGCIDTKGNVVLDPKYYHIDITNEGYILAVEEKYRNLSPEEAVVNIFDNVGKLVTKLKGNKYQGFGFRHGSICKEELIAVYKNDEGETASGLIDLKGEIQLKPKSEIRSIEDLRNGNFIYYDGEAYGVMNIKGEKVLRPKYDDLCFVNDNVLVAKDGNDYFLIDDQGERITKDEYKYIWEYLLDGENLLVQISAKEFGFINKDGKEVKGTPDICNVSIGGFEEFTWIESDYIDFEAIVDAAKITSNGFGGFDINMTPLELLKVKQATLDKDEQRNFSLRPEDNYKDKLDITEWKDDVRIYSYLYYSFGYMSTWDYDYYGNRSYRWASEKPAYISQDITSYKLSGKEKLLMSKVAGRLKTLGKVYSQNDGAIIVTVGNGYIYAHTIENGISITRKNSDEYKNINIGQSGDGTHSGSYYADDVACDSIACVFDD